MSKNSVNILELNSPASWEGLGVGSSSFSIFITFQVVYTEEHSRLFVLLKDPFVVAMSNALKHYELMLLKDMLVDDNQFLQGELRRMTGEEIVGANFGLRVVLIIRSFYSNSPYGIHFPVLFRTLSNS
jgi:hypothetical protein